MSEFIDVQDIAIRNRIAVDGRVNPTVDDWNDLLTHIDRLEQENEELREFVNRIINDISGYDQEEAKYYWRNELEKILNK